MADEKRTPEQEALSRQWASLRLSTGFYLNDLVTTAMSLCDSRVSNMAVRNVRNLINAGCTDEHEWRDAIETLGELCRKHPDAHKASGTWYDGAPTLLAQSAAMEAARFMLYNLYPDLHKNGEIKGSAFKAFRYIMLAMAQTPERACNYLTWLDRVLNHSNPL